MRYAVFSDVHSNLEAFEAVLDATSKSHIDRYVFLGDIVGYGADPGECISHLRKINPLMVAGNHDWGVAGMASIEYFNDSARAGVVWTKGEITESERTFLSGLKLVGETESFCIVHGTLSDPEGFDYMSDGHRAAKTFRLMGQSICFVGHSHRPGVFVDDGREVSYFEPGNAQIRQDRRYIVNDGSVGQPRDGDSRACFCIYDDSSLKLEFVRVEYDIASAQKKIVGAGLPRTLADRLSVGR